MTREALSSAAATETGPSPPGRLLFSASPLLHQSTALLDALMCDARARGEQPRALDVGAGSGRDATVLATSGWAVTALDRDARALARWRGLVERHGCSDSCTDVCA